MTNLTIATGVVTYNLNDTCQVSFNPTDPAFGERLNNTFAELDKQQEARKAQFEAAKDNAEVFALSRELDTEMRAKIDSLFGESVCDKVFGEVNVYAFADGLPLWANLLLAIMDVINEATGAEQSKMNPRLKQYIAKYKKK